jgi:tetratricopeptide (TPR) repeat protein
MIMFIKNIGKAILRSKSILFIPFITLIISQGTSCKKYLAVKTDKSLVIPHTLSDLQGILDDNSFMNIDRTTDFGEASSDDYFLTHDVYNSLYLLFQQCYTWSIKDYDRSPGWENCYIAIYNANYCLEQIKKIDRTDKNENQWNNVKGSALFFRSYYFLALAWDFAKAYDPKTSSKDLGIALRLETNLNVPTKRISVQATYDLILKDTKAAAVLLPDNPSHVMRPSKCAAYGLLARTYLSMRKYDSAYKYADLSLQIKSSLIDYNSSLVNPSSPTPFPPFNKEIIFFSTESPEHSTKEPYYALIDTSLYASYGSNDLRKVVFFQANNDYYAFKGTYDADNRYRLFSGIATDEIYLIRAECEARLGKMADAMNDLNTLLIKRWKKGTFVPLSATSNKQALEIILKERRKELLMRGLRWMDIKRLNKEGANIILTRIIGDKIVTLKPNDNYYALPLPADVIKFSGMEQNPS